MAFRGLTKFIADIREAQSKEGEEARVEKELANIRKNFTGSKTLSVYNRKKYVWKLVYIHLLGYEVDFGHLEVIHLISATTYAEKVVGYLAASVLLHNTDEQIRLIVQSIRNDLQSPKDAFQCLALSAIANIGGQELSESLAPDVQRLMMSRSAFPIVRKRSALCALRLYRVNPETLPLEDWVERIVSTFNAARNLGVILSMGTLILGLIDKDPPAFRPCLNQAILLLNQLAVARTCPSDYMYHTVPCPWLQVVLLRIVAYYPLPSDRTLTSRLNEVLSRVLTDTEVTRSINKNNGEHAVLFEVINIVIKQGEESLPKLRQQAVSHLSRFVNIREPNIRYLGLENMSRMAALPGVSEKIRKQQAAIMVSLKDADISLRRRALDLLFAMCDKSNAQDVVKELLAYLVTAEYAIKDEMVLKTAILAERFAPNYKWYIDTILQLIVGSGDHVSDDVWHRAVQIVSNQEELQGYAARRIYNAVLVPTAHETVVKVGGYILGEYGFWLNAEPAVGGHDPEASSDPVTGAAQFSALNAHTSRVSPSTQALLLSTFIKMQNVYPELQPAVQALCAKFASAGDAELQQRAIEYQAMPNVAGSVMTTVLDSMPPFPDRESILESRLRKARAGVGDQDTWGTVRKSDADGDELPDSSDDEDVAGSDSDSDGGPAMATGRAGAGAGSAAAAAVDDLEEDLLGLSSDPPTPTPTPTPTVTASAPAPAPVAPPSVPVTKRVSVPAEMAAKVRGWRRALAVAPSGVLYDDDTLTIGVQTQFTGATGKMMLHFKNKASVPLTSFKARSPPVAQVKVTFEGEVPASIPAGGQAKCAVSLEAMQPFADPPQLQVSFISVPGTGHAYPLRLPVFLSHFCEGVSLAAADFQTRWKSLTGEPKAQAFAATTPGPFSLDAARKVATGLRMTVLDVPGAPGICAACSFRTMSTSRTGERISVGCLVQIAPTPAGDGMRASVRTQHGLVTQALRDVITMLVTPVV